MHILLQNKEEESDSDLDEDDDTLFAKVPNENKKLKENSKLWIQREKDIARRQNRIKRRLINIASKEHQACGWWTTKGGIRGQREIGQY